MFIRSITSASLALALLAPSLASAQEPVTMGKAGQLVLTDDVSGVVSYGTIEASSGDFSAETKLLGFEIRPAVDYFVTDQITLGVQLTLSYQKATSEDPFGGDDEVDKQRDLGLAARAGFYQPVGGQLGFWGRGLVGYNTSTEDDDSGASQTTDGIVLAADALLVFHPAPHFFIGAGPTLVYASAESEFDEEGSTTVDVTSTAVGLAIEIGGYF